MDHVIGPNVSQRSAEQWNNDQMLEQLKAQRERKKRKYCHQSDGRAESMKGNSEDRSSQSSAELKTLGAAGGVVKQRCGVNYTPYHDHWLTHGVSQSWTGTQIQFGNQATGNYPGAPGVMYRNDLASQRENMSRDETIYIRIPISEMFDREPTFREHGAPPVRSRYKLIDGCPEADGNIDRRTSYAMSFDNRTRNAKWVYEILNGDTLANNCEQQARFEEAEGFGRPYDRGHLAAARNHRWCREAFRDANLNINITPQHESLNRGPWSVFETWTRQLSDSATTHNVHVYSGPLYRTQMNPPYLREKAVPSHFFKVIIVENEDGTVEEPECYLMPNERPNYYTLTQYETNIDYIELISGLRFIERRPNVREDRIITVTLQGHDLNGMTRHANIEVRICYNIE